MTEQSHQFDPDWRRMLREAVSKQSEIGIARVFSALALYDGQQVAARAQAFLDDVAPLYLAEEGAQLPAARAANLRLDLFQETVLAYMESRRADVRLSVDDEIESWLRVNAGGLLSANLRLMEAELGEPGRARTHRAVIKLHQLLDLETFERVQFRALEQVWNGVEATMADLLAASAR